jgi:two-component system chemotaxis sensor kinase CheA
MPKSIDDETREILSSFIAEGYERLDDSEAQLAKMGEDDNTAQLNSVFRLFHSVKGSAGFLGFENIKKLTHEAETMLDVFLKEHVGVTQDALDVVYSTIDVLRKLIGIVETEYTDEPGEDEARKQTALVTAMIATLRSGSGKNDEPKTPAGATSTADSKTTTVDPAIANEIFLSDLVTRDMVHRFLGECADLIDRAEKILLAINPRAQCRDEINDIFRAIHTIKGNSGFFGYAYLERRCMEFESMLDKARNSDGAPGEAFVNTSMHTIDILRAAMTSLVIHDRDATPKQPPEEVKASAQAATAYKPLGEILVDMGVVRDDTLREALDEQERPIGEILVQKGIVDLLHVEEALKIQKTQQPQAAGEPAHELVRKEIRVDTGKLDKLFELVGELITAESMVINNPDIVGLHLDSFTKSFASLNKISREIQETTMMIRMIPLDSLFQKMTRLVRDLSRKMDRPINFLVSGQDTEMDKNVIEQISDPLVHILRNAVDHGIESKEKRLEGGKSETGTIQLDAKYEGSEIWIRVRDDGGGLNREKILEKAASKGMLKGDPDLIPDKDVWAFIFEPGFSTAEVVSDVSGRGVGLDVVKKNLERIRGRIDIKTMPGEGTEFTLAIPLTMAIIDGITVRVGTNRYSLPLNDIIEFFKVTPNQITRTDKQDDTVNIRSEFIPLIKLCEVFRIPSSIIDPCDGIVIVVQNNGRKACLLIDEVIGNQQIVVKSLSEYLGKVDGISGCSILGDGGVSFIIDTGKLLSSQLE